MANHTSPPSDRIAVQAFNIEYSYKMTMIIINKDNLYFHRLSYVVQHDKTGHLG